MDCDRKAEDPRPTSDQELSFNCRVKRRQWQNRLTHFRPCETHWIVIATVMILIGIKTGDAHRAA